MKILDTSSVYYKAMTSRGGLLFERESMRRYMISMDYGAESLDPDCTYSPSPEREFPFPKYYYLEKIKH